MSHRDDIQRIARLSMPAAFTLLGQMVYEVGRTYWASRLGGDSLAAIGAVELWEWLMIGIAQWPSVGATVLIAERRARGDDPGVRAVIASGTLSALLLSICFALSFYFGASEIFRAMGLSPTVAGQAEHYFRWWVFSLPAIFLFHLLCGVYLGLTNTRVSSLVFLAVLTSQSVLVPCLIFGGGRLVGGGIQGVALASLLSYGSGALLLLVHLKIHYRLRLFGAPFESEMLWALWRIGGPVAGTNASWALLSSFVLVITAKFGTEAVAAINAGHALEMIPYYLGLGLGAATTTLVAAERGRNSASTAIDKLVRSSLLLGTCLGAPIALAYVFSPEMLGGVFSSDPSIREHTADYLRTIGYFEIFMIWEMILQGAFSGEDRSLTSFKISFPLTALRIPLAYFLAVTCGWGVGGIWWAISVTTLLKGASLYLSFLRRTYRREG